jgi:hypothetical protein
MLLVIFFIMKRSKKREEEIIEEVSLEAQRSKVLEGEIVSVPPTAVSIGASTDALGAGVGATATLGTVPTATDEAAIGVADQTYLPTIDAPQLPPAQTPAPDITQYTEEPDVETIESYKTQMDLWKIEGYNVSRLEQLAATDEIQFSQNFPIFSSNITKLEDIKVKLQTMDITGHEAEVNDLKTKLNDPDQAIATEQQFKDLESKIHSQVPSYATPTPVSSEDVPPDIDLPPDIGLPDVDTGTEQEQAQTTQQPQPETPTPSTEGEQEPVEKKTESDSEEEKN